MAPQQPVQQKVILEHAQRKSARQSRLERKIEEHIIARDCEAGKEIKETLIKEAIYSQVMQGKAFRIKQMDEMFIRQVVYDDGLTGVGDREKLEKIYEALNVPEDSVATKTKVNQKVQHIVGTRREFRKMLQSDDPSRVARRLVQFVREYIALNRDASGKEELEKLGLRLEGE